MLRLLRHWVTLAACTVVLGACVVRPPLPEEGQYLVDSGGRRIADLDTGGSLEVAARGLQPHRPYEFLLTLNGELVSYSRLTADRQGDIPPFHLWFHSGVVGCSVDLPEGGHRPPFTFRDFEEAEEALAGQTLVLGLRPAVGAIPRVTSRQEVELRDARRLEIPIRPRREAMVYPSTDTDCLLNSAEVGSRDMYVSGRHFEPGELLEVLVVPNQRRWRVGDSLTDVTGPSGSAAPVRVKADARGRFAARVWERAMQLRGAYDIVVRRDLTGERLRPGRFQIAAQDVVSYASDTAYLLFLRYPPGGPLMDVAGRKISGSPYFEFADSFAETGEDVWGAVDPTYVPVGHPGGDYAAYYVVTHRNVAGWTADSSLSDVSVGGPDIMRVKAGCINGTDTVIWPGPLSLGDYDVVVNFGATPAATAANFVDDMTYDSMIDFLDGADQIGFRVARDPYELGPIPVGEATYSFDDEFATFGRANDVDLRAVVRYPAVAAGPGTEVHAGQHPLFLIEHGNHWFCSVILDGTDFYVALEEYYMGLRTTPPWWTSQNYTHATCPDRELNHMGYMHLLEILASHGVIAVSIDAYDLTGPVSQWIEERGDLILSHLEFWSHLNDPATYTTYSDPFGGDFLGHVDMSRISVSGHSRGGEASVAAYIRNQSRPASDQFSINNVSSIAPVDALAGPAYTLDDVPYFVILPAADGDVSDLQGARIYDRAGGASELIVKSGLHVYGANHNFFNTVWAADWDDSWTPRDDFISAVGQQALGEAYLAAFTRSHLLGEDVYEDMLRGRLTFSSTAGRKIYHFRHETSHDKLDAGAGAGAPSAGLAESVVVGPSVHSSGAVQLTWNAAGQTYTYDLTASPVDASGFEVLSFRVAQTNAGTNPSTGQEFRVNLSGGGVSRAVYTGRFFPIPAPYDRKLDDPLGVVTGDATDHNVMTTVRIPLHSFIMNNSGLVLGSIDTVQFIFSNPSQGQIVIDDVEFSR